MHVRAKFYLSHLEQKVGKDGAIAHLKAVCRGDRNAEWSAASPSGDLALNVDADQVDAFKAMLDAPRHGHQPEVFLDLTNTGSVRPALVEAPMVLSGLTRRPSGHGTVELIGKGPKYTDRLTIQITNPPAVNQFDELLAAPEVTLYVTLATDGFPGDGHEFRPSSGPEGTIYGPDRCAECGLAAEGTFYVDAGGVQQPAHPAA